MKRLLLVLVALGAGCRLEAPPESPSAPEAAGRSSDVRAAPGPKEAPARPVAPSASTPTPRAPAASARADLVVTIGRETLRLDAEAVEAVARGTDPYTGAPTLALLLEDEATEAFARMTGANRGKQAVVTLDGRVLMALSVQGRIPNGRLVIPIPAEEADDVEARVRAATGTRPTV